VLKLPPATVGGSKAAEAQVAGLSPEVPLQPRRRLQDKKKKKTRKKKKKRSSTFLVDEVL